jgi:hypothetical protein
MRLFFLVFAAISLIGPCAMAQSTINGFSLPGYVAPGYVIAADAVDGVPGTNRHRIDTQCSVTINAVGSYRVGWQLLAPDD